MTECTCYMTYRIVTDANIWLLVSIHRQGGVTPLPLTDCFLLSLLLNYFSPDSHMWLFSSLARSLPCGGGKLTAEASWHEYSLKKDLQSVCQNERNTMQCSEHTELLDKFCSAVVLLSNWMCWSSTTSDSWPHRKWSSSHLTKSVFIPCTQLKITIAIAVFISV